MLKRMVRRLPVVAVAAALAVVVTGCGITDYTEPSGDITTLMPGWERFFTITWSAAPEQVGQRDIDGYVYNKYGPYANDMRLLVQARDTSDNVIDERIVSVPAGVGGSGRTYFAAGKLAAADHYSVSVWDYTINQAP